MSDAARMLTPENVRVVSELRHRLALGLDCRDAVSGLAAGGPLVAELESIGPFAFTPDRRLDAHGGTRFALAWAGRVRRLMDLAVQRGVAGDWVVRLHADAAGANARWDARRDARRHVPRRLKLRPTLAAGVPVTGRANARACRLFPGATFPLIGAATALRGRVMHDATTPMPWARVIATMPANQQNLPQARVVGRGMADDRGDYLLVLGPRAVSGAQLPPAAQIRLWAFGPATPPPLDGPDPLAGLPVEDAGETADGPVLRGEAIPPAFTRSVSRIVALPFSTVVSGADATLTLP
ncbi:hypothetical protein [Falsiroseomonas sp. HW251]|uniref:hypothetical protein n=1 Tax=Falsiroseomonas sp. HW251 TaxID=3390998 RepID=UPI003D30F90A